MPPLLHTQPLPDDLHGLRAAILRVCLSHARQTAEILDLPVLQPYQRKQLRRLIYALELAGLLSKSGNTSGSLYITTRLGYMMLASLDERLSDNRRPWDVLGIT